MEAVDQEAGWAALAAAHLAHLLHLLTLAHPKNGSRFNCRYVQPTVNCGFQVLIDPLQQLQDMGFTNASQNIRALLATGGNVHSAIEYILGGGGL